MSSTDSTADSNASSAHMSNLDRTLGVRIISASDEEVVLEYEIDSRHHQPYGIVHGGMHCTVVETACSIGASLSARSRGQAGAVGLENHTSFLRAVRAGKVTVTATPLTRGRHSQLWDAVSRDDKGRVVATGRVRLLCLEPGTDLAGKNV